MAEKVKENILGILEKIEKENIQIESKMLTDAKNVLLKLKWEINHSLASNSLNFDN